MHWVSPERLSREAEIEKKPQRILGIRENAAAKFPDVEYRVVQNKATAEWSVFRNGAATKVSARKKKKSAVDSAVRDAKAEVKKADSFVVVTAVEGRKVETVWQGSKTITE